MKRKLNGYQSYNPYLASESDAVLEETETSEVFESVGRTPKQSVPPWRAVAVLKPAAKARPQSLPNATSGAQAQLLPRPTSKLPQRPMPLRRFSVHSESFHPEVDSQDAAEESCVEIESDQLSDAGADGDGTCDAAEKDIYFSAAEEFAEMSEGCSFQRQFLELSTGDVDEVVSLREEMEIVVESDECMGIEPFSTFEEIVVLPDYVRESLLEMKREAPMPIQKQALPLILAGHDLIGIARTGSGKTLAFLLPAIVHIEAQKPLRREDTTPIALILAPTRELAAQICEEAGKLLQNSNQGKHPEGIWAQEIYGGKQRQEQLARCRGCALVAATPGRLRDFVDSGDISLKRVTYFVLDEADRMLDMGFSGDVSQFDKLIRPDRHMLFFSATWPTEVEDLATSLCRHAGKPVIIRYGQRGDGAGASRADIVQQVVVFDDETWEDRDKKKQEFLYAHLRKTLKVKSNKVLVFVSQKKFADELRDTLSEEGFTTESMHGGRKQYDRDNVLSSFKNGDIRLLVATDVMGRGLDIPTISHVVIYDMGDIDDYVHRIGRTARGNTDRDGHALTLFEYNPKWPKLAEGLVAVLRDSQQPVPKQLQRIADQVTDGTLESWEKGAYQKQKWQKRSWENWGDTHNRDWGDTDDRS